MAEALVTIYLVGCFLTALAAGSRRSWRCILLWPIFWLYILMLLAEMALEDQHHG